ncbi:MAG: DNA translocase FtsK 4TM domain-containing protein [Deltaproteobacteria bacterium]|nr:DNA translocase FtsK 4TM domain-containing protein [Deltaproteobacteria bacterium]
MSVAASKTQSAKDQSEVGEGLWSRLRLSESKGKELLGVLLVTIGLLLGLSLVTYHPSDPSVLHHTDGTSGEVRNWIGPLGAQISGLLYGVFGLSALSLPLLFLLSGGRRFRTVSTEAVVGRGIGALILVAALPGLMQLLLGQISWRGGVLQAGGGFGVLLHGALSSQLNAVGSLVVLVAAVITGILLMVQSSLGEVLDSLRQWFGAVWQRVILARARWQERRDKDARGKQRARNLKRVMEKHQRNQNGGSEASLDEGPPAKSITLPPPRVKQRKGEVEKAVRRVRVQPEAMEQVAAPMPGRKTPARSAKAAPQKTIAFAEPANPGQLPPVNLLQLTDEGSRIDENELVRRGEMIRSRCAEFGVEGTVVSINPGPVITVYEFQPAPGVKVSQIVNLQDDLALALKADSVRIDRLAGRSTLGIEVPNKERSVIRLGSLMAKDAFVNAPSPLTLALGVSIGGEPYYADLATMPHLLVAGATGAGKSVGLQSMITSIIYKASREDVQFIFIDPKRVELGVYKSIPHLKAEVVVDPKKAANALRWAVSEMERRYRLLAEIHVRSIGYYNQAIRDPEVQKRLSLGDEETEVSIDDLKPLPYYVIIIDELADLMMVASSEVETCIARLAQMARAVGIHLIIATQRPSVDVLTGTIKANFPCRLAYATTTRHDSRTILDQVGSEQLLGKGDMLFMAPGTSRMVRLHGAYISEQETAGLVRWLRKQGPPELDPAVLEEAKKEAKSGGGGGDDGDELFDEAARLVVAEGQASASFLQRRMRVGFSRAARLIDMMEQDGLLGPPQGSKPREVLVKPDFFEEVDRAQVDG